MPKRKTLTKKTRFEVFKRDSFTCQYCGAQAPDVILHVDHIKPVAKGGDNELINLITSCQPCNSGKTDRELSDDSEVKKQKSQLDDLNERRNQLEMMMEWREGLKGIEQDKLDIAVKLFNDHLQTSSLNESGEKYIKTALKKHPFEKVLDAIELSCESYLKLDDDGNDCSESVTKALQKIQGVIRNKERPEYMQKLFYIRGIVRNRMYCNERVAIGLLQEAHAQGVDVGYLEEIAKDENTWGGWKERMEGLIYGEV